MQGVKQHSKDTSVNIVNESASTVAHIPKLLTDKYVKHYLFNTRGRLQLTLNDVKVANAYTVLTVQLTCIPLVIHGPRATVGTLLRFSVSWPSNYPLKISRQ